MSQESFTKKTYEIKRESEPYWWASIPFALLLGVAIYLLLPIKPLPAFTYFLFCFFAGVLVSLLDKTSSEKSLTVTVYEANPEKYPLVINIEQEQTLSGWEYKGFTVQPDLLPQVFQKELSWFLENGGRFLAEVLLRGKKAQVNESAQGFRLVELEGSYSGVFLHAKDEIYLVKRGRRMWWREKLGDRDYSVWEEMEMVNGEVEVPAHLLPIIQFKKE